MNSALKYPLIAVLSGLFLTAQAQMIKRTDAVWARTVPGGTITIDGNLNEPAWAVADSVGVAYDSSNSWVVPGSGWKPERSGGSWNGIVTDPTRATIKFLVQGNELILGVSVRDSSVGGGLLNECDALMMNIRDHSSPNVPAPSFEYGYGWVTESWADPNSGNPGAPPGYFGGASANRDVWSAATVVQGVSSDDKNGTANLTPDQGYTMEIRFDLTVRGYDATNPDGIIIEFNSSVYDADWQWPYNNSRFYGNRAWWQGPWGNASAYAIGQIHARPDITVNTASIPEIGPDLIIPNAVNHPVPVIDGLLTENVWQNASSLRIAYDDTTLRQAYPGVGPYRSGQYQPTLSGATGVPPVLDPGYAVLKYFFKDDTVYVGVDIQDQVVTSNEDFDRWDGFRVTINARDSLETVDHVLLTRHLDVRFSPLGEPILGTYLNLLSTLGLAQAAVAMKPGTTINGPEDVDAGYTIEMKVALSAFGYPAGRGDGVLFLGATLLDGDKFSNPADDYGTRTWFMREFGGPAGPAWCYMDPSTVVTGVHEGSAELPQSFALIGNYPNPFNPSTTIRYSMPQAGVVTLKVFDVLGRSIATIDIGEQNAGERQIDFHATNLSSGIYFYRLEMRGAQSGTHFATPFTKMILIK